MAVNVINKSFSDFSAKQWLLGVCKAAGDPLRLDILRVLSRDSFGVVELANIFSVPQPGMSHHLKILSQCGLLVTRRQGNSIFYRRAVVKVASELDALQASLYSAVDSVKVEEIYNKKISAVYKERSARSREYFERNADKFQENQGILCDLSQYVSNVKELLDVVTVPKDARVMEVGPGQGELLGELSNRFSKIVAIDDSEEMLALTKAKWSGKGGNIKFVNSSLENYSPDRPSFEAVVLNMVMHHMPSPAKAFQKLGRILTDKGFLLIADLCTHNQEWAKESCGDVWLGFDPQELKQWAEDAGLHEKQSSYLGLKNGFQIQLKLFQKEKSNG